MKYTSLICIAAFLCMLLKSCVVGKETQTNDAFAGDEFSGVFQRAQWDDTSKTNEILEVNRDGTFSICIMTTINGTDTEYRCKGVYWMSSDSVGESLPCVLLQTQDAHQKSSMDRIAYPVDGSLTRIESWSSHDVCIFIHHCDTLFDSYNSIPFIRMKTSGIGK